MEHPIYHVGSAPHHAYPVKLPKLPNLLGCARRLYKAGVTTTTVWRATSLVSKHEIRGQVRWKKKGHHVSESVGERACSKRKWGKSVGRQRLSDTRRGVPRWPGAVALLSIGASYLALSDYVRVLPRI